MAQYLLGIDIGTSACKAAVFREDGTAVAAAAVAYPTEYPFPGWAQQDPEHWWSAACEAVRELLQESGIRPSDIAGIGVDGQSWAMVALDGEGRVICPSPIWTDCRAADACGELARAAGKDRLFACSGNPVMPGYTTPKVKWLQKQRPDLYAKTRKVLQSNGYIVYRLTGVISQDLCQAYGWHCFDMLKGCWDQELARDLQIDPALLPPIHECADTVGHLSHAAADATGLAEGTPVVAGGLDAACGTLGAGVIRPGQTQEQGGQAGGMSICLDTCRAHPKLILSRHVIPGFWLLQGGTTGGGGALRWFREQFCPGMSFEEMNREAEQAGEAEDLIFLPYMAGERSPVWNPKAEGVFWGLNYSVTRGQMIRAVMEGVAFSLRHNLETAADSGCAVSAMRTTGGSGKSALWMQIKTDVTGCPMETVQADIEASWGAAVLAGIGTGVYRNWDSAVGDITVLRRYEPEPEKHRKYTQKYERYLELAGAAIPLMG